MSGLFNSLNMGSEALYSNRQGVATAGHNISNAQTEGFSRQRVDLRARHPLESRGNIIGNGTYVRSIQRAHNGFIEKQLNATLQSSGHSDSRLESLRYIENLYSPLMEATVGEELTQFFNAVAEVSNHPDEMAVRSALREKAKNLSIAFKRVDAGLKDEKLRINEEIAGASAQVNGLLRNIAKLNIDIRTMEADQSQMANDLRDQQERLIRDLSEKIDVSSYTSDQGMVTIRGPKETLLVEAGVSSKVISLPNSVDGSSKVVVMEGEKQRDITDSIEKGSLGAMIGVREKMIPELLRRTNDLAATLADEFNSTHRQGFGLKQYSESMGRDFFDYGGDRSAAAQNFDIASGVAESIDAISVAMSPNAPGDNVIANELLRLKDAAVMEDQSMNFQDYYSNVVGVLGLEVQRADHLKKSDDVMKADITARREAVSGVSLDEEAVNLMKWQSAFAASSKLITTVDEMLETVLSLKR